MRDIWAYSRTVRDELIPKFVQSVLRPLLPYWVNLSERTEIGMIRIPKRDAFKMRILCGLDAVKHTHSKHKTYFLVENPKYLKAYEELKENGYYKDVKEAIK